MRLEKDEYIQMLRLVRVVLREALWDYSYSGDMSVVNVNGQPLIFDNSQLNTLKVLKNKLDEEV